MSHPLARDEDRAPDVKAERVVLERRAVALAHEETDQTGIRVVELLLAAGEGDARAVDDGEVARHGVVQADEPVIQHGDRVLGYDFRHDGQGA